MLVVNYLSNAIPIGGRTQSDISEAYPSLFTPAGFTFSIWGIIYLLLITFTIFLFANTSTLTSNKSTILILFNMINLLNALWLVLWHTDRILFSTIVMLALLGSLLAILTLVSRNNSFAFATFSIYAGWISVATVANIAILLVKLDIPLFMNNQQFFFGLTLFITFIITAYMLFKEGNFYFTGVFIWAYIGIISKFTN